MVKQKIVMKVSMEDSKKRSKALSSAVESTGVASVKLEGDKIVVEGDGIDSIALTTTLRKRMGFVELVSVAAAEEKKEEKTETGTVQTWPSHHIQVVPFHPVYQPYESSCNIM